MPLPETTKTLAEAYRAANQSLRKYDEEIGKGNQRDENSLRKELQIAKKDAICYGLSAVNSDPDFGR